MSAASCRKLAHLRGIPFHPGEQVVRQRESCAAAAVVFMFYLAAARAIGCAFGFCAFAVELRISCARASAAVSNFLRNSATSRRRMMNGGSSRRIWSCVQLISRPLRRASCDERRALDRKINAEDQAFAADFADEIELARPAFRFPARSSAPRSRTFASRSSSSMTFRNSSAAAQTSGPPPKVEPCIPGANADANCSLAMNAPSGKSAGERLCHGRRCPGSDANF